MTGTSVSTQYFMGWDAGAWYCDTNKRSRDAIVILDSALSCVGRPWRGNLRKIIHKANSTGEFVRKLFFLCGADMPADPFTVTLAIDAPLGFPEAFLALAARLDYVDPTDEFRTNPYLFRRTERILSQNGLQPFSAINDMIGSQATKGIHFLAKFGLESEALAVWTDKSALTVIETYPSACECSAALGALARPDAPRSGRDSAYALGDKADALTCALIAYLFAEQHHTLATPPGDISKVEGWIWVPKDCLSREHT